MKLDFLAPVAHQGPWASVYATTGPPDESSAERRELVWRELCRSLEEQGADEATVGAVREELDRAAPGAGQHGLALFASEGRVALTRPLDREPGGPSAVWADLPRVTPLLDPARQAPACLVARVDRSGCDYYVHGAGDGARQEGEPGKGTVEGRDWPLHRAASGDWSASHFDAAVENTWEENAALTADELARVCRESGAEVIMLAGGARECHAVRDHLPAELREVTRISSHGGRAAGSDTDLLTADVEAARLDMAARHAESVLDRFRSGRDEGEPPSSSVEGVPAVADAARQHRLDTLLIGEAGADPGREVWVGDRPDQLAVRRTDAEALGAARPHQARADDALVLCAALSGGEAVMVPGDGSDGTPAGGIGAILRWPRSEPERQADR
ncbi:Vms1/Ankzf1 family peptidyl-tRNA hydrolase [Streptomyces sp. NPDC014779]|uniref:baeRF2 domain-containing protein n=1 Tax=unclassified Streptomyces TaxID=2593676 RepID=UPI0036FDFB0A